MVRKYFITGFILLLPLALTIAVVIFLLNLFTDPFLGGVSYVLDQLGLVQLISSEQVRLNISRLVILTLLFFITVLLGFLAKLMIGHYFIKLWENLFQRIPLVRAIYKTFKDVIQTLFSGSAKSFKQVVLVPYPNKDTISMGFVTREEIPELGGEEEKFVGVFVPTTPNPTSGFLMIFKKTDLIYLDMPVEEALKYIISCGVIVTPFNRIL